MTDPTPPTRPAAARLALVDDHPLVAYSIVAALSGDGIGAVAVPPAPLPELQETLLRSHPRVVLLDLDLGTFGQSLPLIAPLAANDIRVLVLTAATDRIRLAEAIEAGAIGVLQKSADFPALVEQIRAAVLDPRVRIDESSAALLAELSRHRQRAAESRAPFEALTARERETLVELARGATVSEIAAAWFVSETTVRSHVRAILAKLDVQSQLQAVVKAVRNGWVDADRTD